MTKWMISIMLRDGQDTGAIEADSFQELVNKLIARGIELGAAYHVKENRWDQFSDDEIGALEVIVSQVSGSPDSDHPYLDEARQFSRQLGHEAKRRHV